MALNSLAALSPSYFHSGGEDLMSYEIRRVSRIAGLAYLRVCNFSDEHCDCHELGTVHHLESEQDLCDRHFKAVTRG